MEALMDTTHLGGIALDVFPREPWPRLAELAGRPRVLLTPHAAGYHRALGMAVAGELTQAVAAYLEGRPVEYMVLG